MMFLELQRAHLLMRQRTWLKGIWRLAGRGGIRAKARARAKTKALIRVDWTLRAAKALTAVGG